MSDDMPKGLTAEHIDEIWGMIDYHLAYRWDAWGDFRTGLRRLRDEALRATALRAEIERLKGELRKIDDLSGRAAGALSAVAAIQEIAVMAEIGEVDDETPM